MCQGCGMYGHVSMSPRCLFYRPWAKTVIPGRYIKVKESEVKVAVNRRKLVII